jgi:hypothetical protein
MTMDLVNCGSCSAKISAGADRCPKCGARNERKPVELMACRVCGSELEKAAHRRYSVSAGGVYNGTTQYHSSLEHSPCPKCGEPKPLLRPYDDVHEKWLLSGPAVLAGLVWIATFTGLIPGLSFSSGDPPGVKYLVATFLGVVVFGVSFLVFAMSIGTIQWVRKLSWRE